MDVQRGQWSSKLGFIFAAAGSAIGLGNIWRFPYVVGENGGAAFVLMYIIFVAIIGLPYMFAELALGRSVQRNPVGAIEAIKPKSAWKMVGVLGVFTGVGILSFYGVIAGWTFGYIFKMATGNVADFAGFIGYDKEGTEVFAFGKHRGRKVLEILDEEPGYFGWLLNADFPLYTKKVLTRIKLSKLNSKLP
jgi:NSS family neurotransmitter:Na+ symporter